MMVISMLISTPMMMLVTGVSHTGTLLIALSYVRGESVLTFLAADQVDGDTIGDRGNGDGVGSLDNIVQQAEVSSAIEENSVGPGQACDSVDGKDGLDIASSCDSSKLNSGVSGGSDLCGGGSSERIAGSQTISVNCECSWWDHIACIGCNQLTIDHSQIRAGCELTSLRGCGLDSQEEWSRLGTGWGCGRRC